MVDVFLKCFGCEGRVFFTSHERLEKHQKETGHKNDAATIQRYLQRNSK